MKKFMVNCALVTLLFLSPQVNAQVSVNINISSQPAWGPTGYDYVEYYYLPDYEMYYYVPYQKYVYYDAGRWLWVSTIPARYNQYDIYNCYKIVINEPHAYTHHNQHKVKYGYYKNKQYHGKQHVIRDHNPDRQSNLPKNGVSKPQKTTPKKSNLPKNGVTTPQKTTPQKTTPQKSNLPKNGTSTPQKTTPQKSNLPKNGVTTPQKTTPQKSNLPKSGITKPQTTTPQKSNLPKNGVTKQQKTSPQKSNLKKSGKGGH